MAKKASALQRYFRQFDYFLFALILAATGLGLAVLNGSTYDVTGLEGYAFRQGAWWGVSIAVFLVALFLPYGWYRFLSWPLYGLSLALLLLPLFPASGLVESVKAGGASSWIKLSMGAFSLRFQPSELAKIVAVMVLAHWLSLRKGRLNSIWECIVPVALVGLPMALIFKQPDFGTASVFMPALAVSLFVAGLNWRIVVLIIATGCLLAAGSVYYVMTTEDIPGLRNYQEARLRIFLQPLARPFSPPGVEEVLDDSNSSADQSVGEKKSGDDWNIRQAEMALGSGQFFGKGWRHGTQSRLKFLPEHYTDFIFSSLGEQLGLVGCFSLLLFYVLICWRTIRIAVMSEDPFGQYLVIGLITIFMTHVFLNIGMSIRLLPVTGLPLPLISYGGSFLATNYLLFGLIANVGMRRKGLLDKAFR